MAYRTPDDAYQLFIWEQEGRRNGESDDSVSERYASTADDAARFAETEDAANAAEYSSLRSELGALLDFMTGDRFVGPHCPEYMARLRDEVIPF